MLSGITDVYPAYKFVQIDMVFVFRSVNSFNFE